MKKFFLIVICTLLLSCVSFGEIIRDGVNYVSSDFIEDMWNGEIKLYTNSNIVSLKVNNSNYYFQLDTNRVKKDTYINPFFIDDAKFAFRSDDKIEGNVFLENGLIYFPLSFFHNELYSKNYYDVIVVGGDPEGITSAISVARNDGKALLLSQEDGLGGLLTFGMLNTLDMNVSKDGELQTKGIFEEFYNKIGRKESFDVNEVKTIFDEMVKFENNIDYRKNYSFESVILDNNKIIGVIMKNPEGNSEEFYAERIIDATQDGDVCAAAGVPYYVGMQDINSNEKMCVTLCFKVGGVDWELLRDDMSRYASETGDTSCGINSESAWGFGKWCYDKYTPEFDDMRLRGPNFGRQKDGTVLLNALQIFGVDIEDETSVSNAIYYGTREAQSIVKYLKTKLTAFNNAYLLGTAEELYVRETRHIQGEYVLRASDLLNNRNFSDKIALGSYPVDIQSTSKNNYGYVIMAPSQYSIPYRCTVPLNIDNLYIVGKAASYSSVAAGSTRVVPVGMVVGESIGAISMYSIRNDISPRDIIKDIQVNDEIQELLVNQGVYLPEFYIPGPFEGMTNKEQLEVLVDLGIIAGGYSNDFKLNDIATISKVSQCITQVINRSGISVKEDIKNKIAGFSSSDELSTAIMAKMINILHDEYNEEYSDFENYVYAYAKGHFDNVNVTSMYDIMTLQDAYIVIIDAVNRLR